MKTIALRNLEEIPKQEFTNCHEGKGTLLCRSLLDNLGSKMIAFMHHDFMPRGVSIGSHVHEINEEVYYLIKGEGVLTFDGKEYPFKSGDISLCTPGHSHAFLATSQEDAQLIVVGTVAYPQEVDK